jgi:small subunit ribosomal protein S8
MPVTDPIADMLTRIRNAIVPRHEAVKIPASKMKLELARILKEEGFIRGFETQNAGTPSAQIKVHLHYRGKNEPAITGLKRVSKPGLRVYVGKTEIPRYYGGMAVSILSTSEGVMTGRQAWRKGLGGELLCHVW